MNEEVKVETPINGFSLDSLDSRSKADEGVEIEIIAPDGVGTGFMLSLLGEDSKEYRRVQEEQRKRIFRGAMRGTAQAAPKVEEQLAQIDDHALNLLVACTRGWRMANGNIVTFRGAPLPYSKDNARRLYTEGPPIVREQAERAIKDRANFTKRSAST